jgi:dTDP-4-amino-4,6-dideoxygalactose transaminase
MAGVAPGLELPMTDELARTNLALPMSPALRAEQVAEVVASVRACASGST